MTRRGPPPVGSRGPGALTGTRGLVRVALRLDRWRTLGLGAVGRADRAGLDERAEQVYTTPEQRQARATLIASPAATALAGPGYGLDDYTIGAMTANELALWIMLPVAIMALLAVTRHLRAPEEDGRLELVRSEPVGSAAPVVAGLVAATVARWPSGCLTFLPLCPAAGTGGLRAAARGVVVVGLVLAGVSAVASQLSAQARTASSLGMAVVGVAFLLRAMGDVRGPQSTSVLTWLSPFGWAQATAPYIEDPVLAAGRRVRRHRRSGRARVLARRATRRRHRAGGRAARASRHRADLTGVVGLTSGDAAAGRSGRGRSRWCEGAWSGCSPTSSSTSWPPVDVRGPVPRRGGRRDGSRVRPVQRVPRRRRVRVRRDRGRAARSEEVPAGRGRARAAAVAHAMARRAGGRRPRRRPS